MPLDESFLTLAERLREHGYETVGVNENPWVGDPVRGLTQGFDRFVTIESRFTQLFRASSRSREPPSAGAGSHRSIAEAVEQWLAGRSTDRPFFLFLNIMDAHSPYKVRAANPHLPAGVTAGEARAVSQRARDHLCRTPRRSHQMEILWGLYLGGVNAADRKLGRVLEALRQAGADEDLIIVATSDHGEHLGERRLFLHDIGVRQPLIHVPLIVHGLPEVSPTVIDAPVQLLDLLPSILAWVGAEGDTGLPGRRLPTRSSGEKEPRLIVSEYVDPLHVENPEFLRQGIARTRHACGPEDKVSGDARAAMRWPYKLVWYERHANELYDLRADPSEWRDTAEEAPDLAAELEAALPPPHSPRPGLASDTPHPPPDPAFLAKLRALGYLDDSEAHEAVTDGAGER
jgi:arylsulfatase A-like enzyme